MVVFDRHQQDGVALGPRRGAAVAPRIVPAGDRAGLPGEPGRRFCQDLALELDLADLAAEPGELLPLGRRQAIRPVAGVTRGLRDPVADGLGGRAELAGQLVGRATEPSEVDDRPGFPCRARKLATSG